MGIVLRILISALLAIGVTQLAYASQAVYCPEGASLHHLSSHYEGLSYSLVPAPSPSGSYQLYQSTLHQDGNNLWRCSYGNQNESNSPVDLMMEVSSSATPAPGGSWAGYDGQWACANGGAPLSPGDCPVKLN